MQRRNKTSVSFTYFSGAFSIVENKSLALRNIPLVACDFRAPQYPENILIRPERSPVTSTNCLHHKGIPHCRLSVAGMLQPGVALKMSL
jgi:hypothetical protein